MAIGFVLMTTHPGKEATVRQALEKVDLVTAHWMLFGEYDLIARCLLYTSPSPRDRTRSRMPSSA